MEEKELQDAQRNLEQKRAAHAKVRPAVPAGQLLPEGLEASSTAPTNGNAPRCEVHHRDYEDGVCPVCEEQHTAWAEAGKKEAAKRLETLLGGIRLGSRYQDTRFPDYQPTCDAAKVVKKRCEMYATTFDCRLLNGDNLLMLGNYGTGKNMLAACICNEIAQAGYAPLHTTILKMLRRIKETWKKESKEAEQSVIDSFILPDLLVVDEIGVQFGTESEKQLTFEALNGRSEEKKPTILISNLTDERALAHYLGARVMDRVKEGRTGVLNFTWESYRVSRE